MSDEESILQERLTPDSVKRIKATIEVFRKEFPDQCNWDGLPQPEDQSDEQRDKVLISTFGFLVQNLIDDDEMLQQARKNPELKGLAITAEQLKANM